MAKGASEVFVKGLKNKISEKNIKEEFDRNILQNSLMYLVDLFKLESEGDLQVRTVRDFQIKEVCFFIDVVSKYPIEDALTSCFIHNKIPGLFKKLDDNKCIFRIDLENRLITSGNNHNYFFIEIYSKRGFTYKIKLSLCERDLNYSLYEKGYHYIKFWTFEENKFEDYEISLRKIDRKKKSQKIETPDEKYIASISLNDIGELNNFELSKKKRRKKEDLDYNNHKKVINGKKQKEDVNTD